MNAEVGGARGEGPGDGGDGRTHFGSAALELRG